MQVSEVSMSAILAQFNILEGADIPPLPSAPAIERLLLANPWPATTVLVLLAIAVFVVLNARGKLRQGAIAAGVLAALAALAFGLSTLIETDREALKMQTNALVSAVIQVDRPEMEKLLEDDLSMRATRIPRNADKQQVINTVESVLGGLYQVTDHDILETQAAIYGPRVGSTQVRVRVASEFGALPSWWRIDWKRGDDGFWRASRIEALWIPGIPNPGG
jgi:hypothetical protein